MTIVHAWVLFYLFHPKHMHQGTQLFVTVFIFFSNHSISFLNIVFFVVVVVFQPWTGWWFSLNDIVGLYILTISLTWQDSNVLYLNFGIICKSGIHQYVFNIPPSLHHTPPPLHSPPQYPLPLPPLKISIIFRF